MPLWLLMTPNYHTEKIFPIWDTLKKFYQVCGYCVRVLPDFPPSLATDVICCMGFAETINDKSLICRKLPKILCQSFLAVVMVICYHGNHCYVTCYHDNRCDVIFYHANHCDVICYHNIHCDVTYNHENHCGVTFHHENPFDVICHHENHCTLWRRMLQWQQLWRNIVPRQLLT